MKKVIAIITLLSLTIFGANAQNVATKQEFNKTLTAYFATKNALAKDDVSLAAASAKDLLSSLSSFPVKGLNAAQQTVWNTESKTIRASATSLIAETTLKDQRKSFWPLSSALLKMTKELKLNTSDIYVQYCPMAKKSWLNEVAAVQNPFYGSMMYDCGEVTETIVKK